MPKIDVYHPDYILYIDRWRQVEDVVSSRVKARGEVYLPKPSSHISACQPDKSTYTIDGYFDESAYARAAAAWTREVSNNTTRYGQYVMRALFYNFTRRTLSAMVGGVFRKAPTATLPPALDYIISDSDGAGLALDQHAKNSLSATLKTGRAGLLVDMPATDAQVSRADMTSRLAPRIRCYRAEDIINWRCSMAGAGMRLNLVVLREYYDPDPDNVFEHRRETQYRVLQLNDNGLYSQTLYRNNEPIAYAEPIADGQRLTSLPFYFVGAENNDPDIDDAPLFDLSEVNIAHYRNSADNEESSFLCGQPTLVIAPGEAMGSAQQFSEANPGGVTIGARSGLNVGPGGSAQLLQAAENNLAKQNMRDKEEQALQLGAELITPSQQETAEAARIKRGADTSVISSVADNVSRAYTDALTTCAQFLAAPADEINYQLNTDFFLIELTAQDRAQFMAEVMAGIMPREYLYSAYRKSGIVPSTATDADIAELLLGASM